MKRAILLLALATVVGSADVALAQEQPGAGRVEIGFFPGGGTFFTKGSESKDSGFKNYALGASVTWNATPFVGVEGEFGSGIAVRESGMARDRSFENLKGPSTFAYNGNIIVAPGGSHRSVVPYIAVGMGGLTLRAGDELRAALGLDRFTSYLSENVGGGVKWYSRRRWGLRADYRFIQVNGRDTGQSFFGLNETRYGHRVHASLLLAY